MRKLAANVALQRPIIGGSQRDKLAAESPKHDLSGELLRPALVGVL
jgi:hypothetical protein